MSERIFTRCPACKNDTLIINKGHLLCTWLECKDPVSIDQADRIIPALMDLNTSLQKQIERLEGEKLWLEGELASARVYLEKSQCSCYSYTKEGGGRETRQCQRCEGLDKLKFNSPCSFCNGHGIILHYRVQDHVDQETCEYCKGTGKTSTERAMA